MSTVVILWLGGYQIDSGELQIGDIMAIIEYATLILMNLIMAVFVLLDVPEASSAMVEFKNYCCTLKIKSPRKILLRIHSAKELINTVDPEKNVPTVSGKNSPLLEFRHVTFRYDDAEEAALKDISFTLKAGETMAVMGDIGSGKSTLAKLILGLYPIESGDILFDGKSIFHTAHRIHPQPNRLCAAKSLPLHRIHRHESFLRQGPKFWPSPVGQ